MTTDASTDDQKDEARVKITKLREAKDGWQGLLDRNSKLYTDATTGKLNAHLVTHLVADALLRDQNGADKVTRIGNTETTDVDPIRRISAIR